jgi:DNA replication protein DnaC
MQFMAGLPIRWAGCSACNLAERQREEDEAKRKAEEQRQARLESKLKAAGIPPALRDRSFTDYQVESADQQRALDAVREFADNFWSRHLPAGAVLVLAGERGNGKGHLAIACAKQVMQRGTAMYLRTSDLIRMVRATWRRDSKQSEQEVIDALCALDLLVIDEVGVQRGTDDEQIILFDVIDRRYADLRPTVLITNLNGAAFEEMIGPRIMDRLVERAVYVRFNWESYRGRVSQ